MAKTRRAYTGGAVSTTTSSNIAASGTTSFTVTAATGWPYGSDPFFVVVEPGTASEEKILVTRAGSGDTTINIASDSQRGQDGTVAVSHSNGATVFPVFTALDADEANELASKWTTKGDLVSYGSSTFERLGVGTNDHVLTAASGETSGLKWGQVATGGIANDAVTTAKIDDEAVTKAKISTTDYAGMGLVLVKPSSAVNGTVGANGAVTIGTAVSSVTVNGAFSSTFDNYRITVIGGAASANGILGFQLGASTTAYYQSRLTQIFATNASSNGTDNNTTKWSVVGGAFTNGLNASFDLMGPNLSKYTFAFGGYGNTDGGGPFYNEHRVATAYTSFILSINAGTMTGGTIRVYGYNNG